MASLLFFAVVIVCSVRISNAQGTTCGNHWSVLLQEEKMSPSQQIVEEIKDGRSLQQNMDRMMVDKGNEWGLTPLHGAAMMCHTSIVQVLLENGADPTLEDAEGNTPLHLAADCPEALPFLILGGSVVDSGNRANVTALHLAVRAHKLGSIAILLEYGASTNLTDLHQRTAIDEAIATKNQSIIDVFKANGANVGQARHELFRNSLPLSTRLPEPEPVTTQTTVRTHPEEIFFKERSGPLRVVVKRPMGKERELLEAVSRGLEGTIADLCSSGVEPNFADLTNNHYTPLHLATMKGESLAILSLIVCGAKVNIIDKDGNTPLHLAVLKNDSWAASVLLMKRANPHIANRSGKTAFQLAKKMQDVGIRYVFDDKLLTWYRDVRKLSVTEKDLHHYTKLGRFASGVAKQCVAGVDSGVKDADNKERTALHLAVTSNYNVVQTVQVLVRCGGNVNARDVDGNTPLHLAVSEGMDQAFTTLLLNRADPFLPNYEGKTAHQLASESKSEYIKYTSTLAVHRYDWYMNSKYA